MTVKSEDLANIRGMSMENGKVSMELEVARELMLAMAASAIALLEDAHAPNFIEMEFKCANADIPHTVVSIGYTNRPTPLEIIAKLREELLSIYDSGEVDLARIADLMIELGYEDMLDGA